MKNFLIILVCFLLGCSLQTKSQYESIEVLLFSTIHKGTQESQYKACIYLAELALSSSMVNRIKNNLNESTCQRYLLARRSGEYDAVEEFISFFPNPAEQKRIWNTHRNAGYPISYLPPYFEYLSTLAITNDKALNNMVAMLNLFDGGHAEAIIEIIARLFINHRKRINVAFDTNNTSKDLIELIERSSEYYHKGL